MIIGHELTKGTGHKQQLVMSEGRLFNHQLLTLNLLLVRLNQAVTRNGDAFPRQRFVESLSQTLAPLNNPPSIQQGLPSQSSGLIGVLQGILYRRRALSCVYDCQGSVQRYFPALDCVQEPQLALLQ